MIHVPIFANRVAQFAAKFVPLADGRFAFHASDSDDGVPVTAAEYAALTADHARIIVRTGRVAMWWLALAVIANIVLMFWRDGERLPGWIEGASFVLPMPWVIYEWLRAERLPVELAGRRVPVAPPRGIGGGARARVAALPVSVPLMLVGLGLLLIGRIWYDGHLASDWLWVLYGLAIAGFGGWILAQRRHR